MRSWHQCDLLRGIHTPYINQSLRTDIYVGHLLMLRLFLGTICQQDKYDGSSDIKYSIISLGMTKSRVPCVCWQTAFQETDGCAFQLQHHFVISGIFYWKHRWDRFLSHDSKAFGWPSPGSTAAVLLGIDQVFKMIFLSEFVYGPKLSAVFSDLYTV